MFLNTVGPGFMDELFREAVRYFVVLMLMCNGLIYSGVPGDHGC